MQRAFATVVALGVVFLSGCGSSSQTSDTAVRETLERGVAQIGEPQTAKQLHDDLVGTLAKLRGERASTVTGRRARTLAIQGFTWMLRSIDARLEMTRNDSGNLEASVHDARRSDRDRHRGAKLLRAAGQALGVRIGNLSGP
jgi:hypothetical protein